MRDHVGRIDHRHIARSTKTIDRGARDRYRQLSTNHSLARDVAPGDAFRVTAAEDRILDQRRIDSRTFDGRAYRECCECRPRVRCANPMMKSSRRTARHLLTRKRVRDHVIAEFGTERAVAARSNHDVLAAVHRIRHGCGLATGG